jgi:hypothetical protein
MPINSYEDPISDGLAVVNDALRLLCDFLLAVGEDEVGELLSCRRRRGAETVQQIDAASAALRRVGILMLNAGYSPIDGHGPDLPVSGAGSIMDNEDIQGRWRNFELALSFFRVACRRYTSVLMAEKAPLSLRDAISDERARALAGRELRAAGAAIRRLHLSAAMLEPDPYAQVMARLSATMSGSSDWVDLVDEETPIL